jgi:hypothetical protein
MIFKNSWNNGFYACRRLRNNGAARRRPRILVHHIIVLLVSVGRVATVVLTVRRSATALVYVGIDSTADTRILGGTAKEAAQQYQPSQRRRCFLQSVSHGTPPFEMIFANEPLPDVKAKVSN